MTDLSLILAERDVPFTLNRRVNLLVPRKEGTDCKSEPSIRSV